LKNSFPGSIANDPPSSSLHPDFLPHSLEPFHWSPQPTQYRAHMVCRKEREKAMFKITLKALIALSSIVSGAVIFNADADAAGKRRGFAFSASPVIMKTSFRRPALRRMKTNSTRRAAGRRPVMRLRARVKSGPRPRYVPFVKKPQFTGNFGVPAQSAAQKPSSAEVMAGFCNGAGGGASSNPDGTVSCVGPDGNDVLDPVPAPN
jgi:hypothetical protein